MPRCISTRTHVDITYRRVFASFSSYNAIIPLHSVLSSIFRPQVRIGRLLLQSRSQKERWGPSFFVGPGTCIGPVWTVPTERRRERRARTGWRRELFLTDQTRLYRALGRRFAFFRRQQESSEKTIWWIFRQIDIQQNK